MVKEAVRTSQPCPSLVADAFWRISVEKEWDIRDGEKVLQMVNPKEHLRMSGRAPRTLGRWLSWPLRVSGRLDGEEEELLDG